MNKKSYTIITVIRKDITVGNVDVKRGKMLHYAVEMCRICTDSVNGSQ